MDIKIKKNEKKTIKSKKKEKKFDIVACGGVVFHFDEDRDPKVLYLLLKHKGGKKHWALPKGHLEKGETYKECAIREIKEETGISKKNLILHEKLDHKTIYEKPRKFRRNKLKVVHLYLFQSLTNNIFLSKEHISFKWVPFYKIKKKLTFPTSYPAFVEANNIIVKKFNLVD